MKEKRSRKANWLLIAAIFVVVTVVSIVNPADTVVAYVEDQCLVLKGCQDVQYSIPLDSISRVVVVEEPEYAADGRGVVCGTYTNEAWGEHILYANLKIDACIVLESTNGTYVFNVESEETTRAFCQALGDIL